MVQLHSNAYARKIEYPRDVTFRSSVLLIAFYIKETSLMSAKIAVVAIGGNSLIQDNAKRELNFQWDAVRETCSHIACMIRDGWRVVITHGNGPQVGFI